LLIDIAGGKWQWQSFESKLTTGILLMKAYFAEQIERAAQMSASGDLRLHVVSSIRLLLQQVIFGMLEWASNQKASDHFSPPSNIAKDMLSPSDGALVDLLESTVIYCEQLGWGGASKVLFAALPSDSPSSVYCLGGDYTITSLLRGLVRVRNDGAEGHGLVGGFDRGAELDSLRQVTKCLQNLAPRVDEAGFLLAGPEDSPVKLAFLRTMNSRPILIRRLRQVVKGKFLVEAQYLDASNTRQDFKFECQDCFASLKSASPPRLVQWENSWRPLCYLPERTTESFKGRGGEQASLSEWMNDEGARVCLVFGDGGVGKTTLVVEFLHRLLEEDPDLGVEWKPKLVTYYTAKKWRWGLGGVELISAGQPHLMGLIAHIHQLIFGKLPPEDFYRLTAAQAAMRLQQSMKLEMGIERSDHLIIVDNAETLIASDREIEVLGKELTEIARRVGRIIITSRRREALEAAPVAVEALDRLDAVALLKERGALLSIKAIKKASDAELLTLVTELECRPLVLEALIQALTESATVNLKAAKERVTGMLRRDLGEFLFADAWSRYSQDVKILMLLLTRMGDVIDAQQLSICADIVGVSLQLAEEALDESSGIASVVRIDGGLEVSFSQSFLAFAKDRIAGSGADKRPTSADVESAQARYRRYVRAAGTISGDRVASAFRTPLAKAAYQARKDGDMIEALKLYRQAILVDRDNGWLFDRFAYFLFHDERDYPAALQQAMRATELLPDEGEVWFTRGLVESRLGLFRQTEVSMDKAQGLGIGKIRCSIQLAWAYLKARPKQLSLASQQVNYLKQALTNTPRTDRNWIETERLIARLATIAPIR
jgi:tetratricopeptide (TPR) repeat protein